jgi:hypothetical protein
MSDDRRVKSTRGCNPESVGVCESSFASALSGRKLRRSEARRTKSALAEKRGWAPPLGDD